MWISLGERLYYYLQDTVPLGKVFARGEGTFGDKLEKMTPGGCLQRGG